MLVLKSQPAYEATKVKTISTGRNRKAQNMSRLAVARRGRRTPIARTSCSRSRRSRSIRSVLFWNKRKSLRSSVPNPQEPVLHSVQSRVPAYFNTLALTLTSAGRKLLAAHHGHITARLTITGTGGAAAISQSKTVTLVLSRHH